MRIALVNPSWTYDNSIYFGCRDAHFPIELGCAKGRLEASGHETLLVDGQLAGLGNEALATLVADFGPEITVVTTAPTYLFWRCTPPELSVPGSFLSELSGRGGLEVAVGPHGSVTPGPTLHKLGVEIVVRGECEDAISEIATADDPRDVPGTAWMENGGVRLNGVSAVSRFVDQPALVWPDEWIAAHRHHHHRFDARPDGPGAEVEASRGCPYHCSFCAKIDYRDAYRRRQLASLLEEIDGLIAQGVSYVYFIDEIFLPQKPLLEALVDRPIAFGVQTRIDLWSEAMLELLGKAGCVSIEAGVESLTVEGRAALDKKCRMTTDALADRLLVARQNVPFVQANLIATEQDDPEMVAEWRERLREQDVWANDPVPLYPYPSSPAYRQLWGLPDDHAWERAHAFYLGQFDRFSDVQDQRPLPLAELERNLGRG